MGRIAKSTVDAVHQLRILEVLKPYNLSLKKSGANYMCCCPFHSENSPSFSVSPSKNICKCFSCGKGGDPIHFVMEMDGLTYREAIEYLAKEHNIQLQYEDGEPTEKESEEDRKRESMKLALTVGQSFFEEQYNADTPEAKAARDYAISRWGEDFCKSFSVGYAPKDSNIFLEYLRRNGFSIEPFIEVGLVGVNEQNGKPYATLRQRVSLPVKNRTNNVVSFSARYVGANPDIMKRSKYMNLKESPVFNKSEILFGKYAAELLELVQTFINDYEHPEDGILLINLDNIDDKKIVYIEETLKPTADDDEWVEYPLIDLMKDSDALNEKWEIDSESIAEIADELLNI